MPKNWSGHEAEIQRLYMEEGRTLKEVRNIMAEKFGFEASIRAYRMKFDDLGWKKNRSTKSRRNQKQPSRIPQYESAPATPDPVDSVVPSREPSENSQLSLSDIDPVAQMLFKNIFKITIPKGSRDVAEMLPLVEGIPPTLGLQVLLLKWQPGGAYLKASQDYILGNHHRFDQQFSTFSGGTIFTLIEQKLDVDEQCSLGKTCLEADLDPRKLRKEGADTELSHNLADESFLEMACKSSSWSHARHVLFAAAEGGAQSELILRCSLVVVAEIFLKRYKAQLDDLHWDWIDDLRIPLDDDNAANLRRNYMKVLEYFETLSMNVDLLFYKYALTIAAWDQALSEKKVKGLQMALELMNGTKAETSRISRTDRSLECIHTNISPDLHSTRHTSESVAHSPSQDIQITDGYVEEVTTVVAQQAKIIHEPSLCSSFSEPRHNSNHSPFEENQTFLSFFCSPLRPFFTSTPHQNIPASQMREDCPEKSPEIQHSPVSDGEESDFAQENTLVECPPSEALKFIYDVWKSEKSITSHVHELLERDGVETSLFFPPRAGVENMFDLIDQEFGSDDKLRFTGDLLLACQAYSEANSHYKLPSFRWWFALYTSESLEEFQYELELQPIHLRKVMSARGIELLSRCTTMAVGKDLLRDLQALINDGQFSALQEKSGEGSAFNAAKHLDDCQQFVDVLKILKAQDLEVEQSSYDFSVKMLQWELGERRRRQR